MAVVVQHHLVVLAAEAGLFVSSKGGVRGVSMVVVHPHAAGLDSAGHLL